MNGLGLIAAVAELTISGIRIIGQAIGAVIDFLDDVLDGRGHG